METIELYLDTRDFVWLEQEAAQQAVSTERMAAACLKAHIARVNRLRYSPEQFIVEHAQEIQKGVHQLALPPGASLNRPAEIMVT